MARKLTFAILTLALGALGALALGACGLGWLPVACALIGTGRIGCEPHE